MHDSHGNPREGAIGSRSRREFKRLPCVGARTARTWWHLGLRLALCSLVLSWHTMT